MENSYSYSQMYFFMVPVPSYDCCGVIVCSIKTSITTDYTNNI